jgi:RHS repeat-associated protein
MQLASGSHIPDGLPAAGLLLSEKPRHGVASRNPAPHPGIDERNSTLVIGLRASLALDAVRQSERARYYSSNDARWMTPDWSSDPEAVPYADLTDPQSLNLYSYVGNNPLSSSDSDGHVQVCGATTVSTDANGDTVVHANCRNVQVDTSFATRVQNAWDSFQNFINSQPTPYVPGVNSLGAPACACMQNSNQQQNNKQQSTSNQSSSAKRKWTYGWHKSAKKWASQMAARGWTEDQIDEAIEHGEQFSAPNDVNKGNGATRFVNPTTGRSVVVDNVTGEILHVGGDGFKY